MKVPRKRIERRKRKAKATSHVKTERKPTPRKSVKGPSFDAMPMLPKRTVSEATLEANRRRIQEQEHLVRAGKLQPKYLGVGEW